MHAVGPRTRSSQDPATTIRPLSATIAKRQAAATATSIGQGLYATHRSTRHATRPHLTPSQPRLSHVGTAGSIVRCPRPQPDRSPLAASIALLPAAPSCAGAARCAVAALLGHGSGIPACAFLCHLSSPCSMKDVAGSRRSAPPRPHERHERGHASDPGGSTSRPMKLEA